MSETTNRTPADLSPRKLMRDILQKSSVYMLSSMVYRLVSLLMFPIISRRLTPADYGVLDALDQVTSVASVLLGASFSSSLGYFINRPVEADKDPQAVRANVLGTVVIGSALLGLLTTALGILTTPTICRVILQDEKYTPYLYAMFVMIPASFTTEAFLGWMRVENLALQFAAVSTLRAVLALLGISVLLGVLHLGIWGMLITNNLAALLAATCGLIVCLRHYRLRFDSRLFLQMLRFSIPLTLSGLALFVLHFGDRLLLPRYRPLAELGIYSLAYKFGMLLTLIQSSFDWYWSSQIYRLVKRPDASQLFGRIFTYAIGVFLFAALGILVTGRIAIQLLATPAYYGAISLFPIVLLAYCVRSSGDFFRCVFYALGLPSYDALFNWGAALITLAGYLILIPRFGAAGAATATVLGFAFVAVVCPLWLRRLWPYELEYGRLLTLVGVSGVLAAIALLLPLSSLVLELAQAAILLVALPVLLLLARFPHRSELDALNALQERYLPRLSWCRF